MRLTQIVITKTAYADLVKLNKPTRKRLKDRITSYLIMDNPLLHAVKLKNKAEGTYRWRIGDYRIVFDIDKNKVVLLRVQHRQEIYNK